LANQTQVADARGSGALLDAGAPTGNFEGGDGSGEIAREAVVEGPKRPLAHATVREPVSTEPVRGAKLSTRPPSE